MKLINNFDLQEQINSLRDRVTKLENNQVSRQEPQSLPCPFCGRKDINKREEKPSLLETQG